MHVKSQCTRFTVGIKLKVWKDEVVGTTMMRSSVLNLHQPDKKLPAKGLIILHFCITDCKGVVTD